MMFDNTKAIWDFARPRLAGRWWRVEVVHPDGFPDLMGFYQRAAHYIEIKANGDTMRTSQKLFMADAIHHGISAYVLAAQGARLAWFQDVDLKREVDAPKFYRTV